MKRIISLFLLLICLALPVFATDSVSPYVVDDANLLSESEYWELSDVLEEISQRLQMDVVALNWAPVVLGFFHVEVVSARLNPSHGTIDVT